MSEEIDSIISGDIEEMPAWAFKELEDREHSAVAADIERSKGDRGTVNKPTGHIDTYNYPSIYNNELRNLTNTKRRREGDNQIEEGYNDYMQVDSEETDSTGTATRYPKATREAIQTVWSEGDDTHPDQPTRFSPHRWDQLKNGNGYLPDHLDVPQWQLHTLDPH